MKRLLLLRIGLTLLVATIACDDSDRIAKLEKETREVRGELEKLKTTSDYDLQEKCNRDGKEWLRDNWRNEKGTIFMTYTVHYKKADNSCFIVVEQHVKSIFGDDGSWSNVIGLWDVLENNKYASIQVDHLVHFKPQYNVGETVVQCEVAAKECKSLDEFNSATRPYMSN
jgi:hypothetical protein